MEAHRLSEINTYIRQVIALNFNEPLWIMAEISQVKNSKGHYYLDLVEKEDATEEVVASAQAVIWYSSCLFIRKKIGDLFEELLTAGTQIQCKVKVDFHEKFGLKFLIEDIDPSYTFGQLELDRQQTIERLSREELLGKNKETHLPLVIQNIAVISSAQAAGWHDFSHELTTNPYGYAFQTELFQASMQGKMLESEVLEQLSTIRNKPGSFDCVVIIRGGGSKLDLSGFDSYAISAAVAQFPIPVITGIGHEVDTTIIELVAHSPLKTPTAAAQYVIDHNVQFESAVFEHLRQIRFNAHQRIHEQNLHLSHWEQRIIQKSQRIWQRVMLSFEKELTRLSFLFRKQIIELDRDVSQLHQTIEQSDPSTILRKGFTLSYLNGKRVATITDIKAGDELESVFADGSVFSSVKRIKTNRNDKTGG